ncbi:hypothetical protein O6H91_Y548600 [Diphasiastrum complanatum]|nr:hypothetical protein O6H91_Y548600 [Diphasiastrum complanatum]
MFVPHAIAMFAPHWQQAIELATKSQCRSSYVSSTHGGPCDPGLKPLAHLEHPKTHLPCRYYYWNLISRYWYISCKRPCASITKSGLYGLDCEPSSCLIHNITLRFCSYFLYIH